LSISTLKKKDGLELDPRTTWRVAHHKEEKQKFNCIDEKKDDEEEVEPGQRKGGEPAQESVRGQRKAKHFGGEGKAGSKFSVAGVEDGKGKGKGN
jgi:hypothetical protein